LKGEEGNRSYFEHLTNIEGREGKRILEFERVKRLNEWGKKEVVKDRTKTFLWEKAGKSSDTGRANRGGTQSTTEKRKTCIVRTKASNPGREERMLKNHMKSWLSRAQTLVRGGEGGFCTELVRGGATRCDCLAVQRQGLLVETKS